MKNNPIKLIETEAEYKAAQQRVAELTKEELEPNSSPFDEVNLLLVLIEDYQKKHVLIEEPDPIEYLKIRMEELGLEPKDLVQYIGDRSTVTKILNKKRELTAKMMKELHRGLNIPTSILLGA